MSDESKTPKMPSSDSSSKSGGTGDVEEKKKQQGVSDSSDKGSHDKTGSKEPDSNSGGQSNGGAESKADANEKSGSGGGKSSGLAVGDAAGTNVMQESKGGADTKANEDMSGGKNGILGGRSGGKKKSPVKRLAALGSKAIALAQAALHAAKTLFMMQFLAWLQALLSAIAAAIASAVSAVATVVMTIATTIATALGISVAVAAVGVAGLAVVAVIAVAAVVISVVINNTAVKDEARPCEEVNMEYMEVPDEIPPQAWTNAKLIYTFFKSYGEAAATVSGNPEAAYTDEMIAAILGNWYLESHIDTSAVETVIGEEQYAIGPKKLFLWKGGVDVTWDYHEETTYDADGNETGTEDVYDGTIIDPFYEFSDTVGFLGNPDDTTTIDDYADTHGYGVSKDNPVHHEPIMFEVKWFQDIYQAAYWDTYPAINYMGIGLGQWTNSRNTDLLDWADEKGRMWYDLDLQLMYCLTENAKTFFETWVGSHDISSYTTSAGETYVDGMLYDGTVMASAAEIASDTEKFFNDWEGIDNDTITTRIEYAMLWYNIITEWTEGVDYVLGTGSSLWSSLESASVLVEDVTQASSARSCNDLIFMGNSSLAEAMVSYAWAPDKDDHNDGTKCWRHLFSTLAPGDRFYRSCDRTVAIGVWWSGTDSNYPLGSTKEQLRYLVQKDAQYRAMLSSGTSAGMTDDTAWWMKVDVTYTGDIDAYLEQLHPGDVLIRNDLVSEVPENGSYTRTDVGHTLCYVGPETIQRRWPDADPSYCIVSGSLNSRSPSAGTFTYGGGGGSDYTTYYVFRNMKTYCADTSKTNVALTCAGHSNDE